MEKILLELISLHHVKRIDENTFSVICSHQYQLEDISQIYNIILDEVFNNHFTVQGIFKIK